MRVGEIEEHAKTQEEELFGDAWTDTSSVFRWAEKVGEEADEDIDEDSSSTTKSTNTDVDRRT